MGERGSAMRKKWRASRRPIAACRRPRCSWLRLVSLHGHFQWTNWQPRCRRRVLSVAGGDAFSRAIMTTDTVKKNRALKFACGGRTYTIAGTAKGAGMAHPNMATVFCFLTTDANIGSGALQALTKSIGDRTINMVDVDMDTSTSDMMLIFANGAAGGPDLAQDRKTLEQFEAAAHAVCLELAKDLARDGEGAKTLIECVVQGAQSEADARIAARTVVSSPLIKTMITGRDPNLGRVMMALGRSEQKSTWRVCPCGSAATARFRVEHPPH